MSHVEVNGKLFKSYRGLCISVHCACRKLNVPKIAVYSKRDNAFWMRAWLGLHAYMAHIDGGFKGVVIYRSCEHSEGHVALVSPGGKLYIYVKSSVDNTSEGIFGLGGGVSKSHSKSKGTRVNKGQGVYKSRSSVNKRKASVNKGQGVSKSRSIVNKAKKNKGRKESMLNLRGGVSKYHASKEKTIPLYSDYEIKDESVQKVKFNCDTKTDYLMWVSVARKSSWDFESSERVISKRTFYLYLREQGLGERIDEVWEFAQGKEIPLLCKVSETKKTLGMAFVVIMRRRLILKIQWEMNKNRMRTKVQRKRRVIALNGGGKCGYEIGKKQKRDRDNMYKRMYAQREKKKKVVIKKVKKHFHARWELDEKAETLEEIEEVKVNEKKIQKIRTEMKAIGKWKSGRRKAKAEKKRKKKYLADEMVELFKETPDGLDSIVEEDETNIELSKEFCDYIERNVEADKVCVPKYLIDICKCVEVDIVYTPKYLIDIVVKEDPLFNAEEWEVIRDVVSVPKYAMDIVKEFVQTEIEDENCCICMCEVHPYERAILPECGHTAFHYECIAHWGGIENSCPVCKFRFDYYRYKMDGIAEYEGTVFCVEKKQPTIDNYEERDRINWDDERCCKCGTSDGTGFLCCDGNGCQNICHISCNGGEVPSGAWYCYECVAEGVVRRIGSPTLRDRARVSEEVYDDMERQEEKQAEDREAQRLRRLDELNANNPNAPGYWDTHRFEDNSTSTRVTIGVQPSVIPRSIDIESDDESSEMVCREDRLARAMNDPYYTGIDEFGIPILRQSMNPFEDVDYDPNDSDDSDYVEPSTSHADVLISDKEFESDMVHTPKYLIDVERAVESDIVHTPKYAVDVERAVESDIVHTPKYAVDVDVTRAPRYLIDIELESDSDSDSEDEPVFKNLLVELGKEQTQKEIENDKTKERERRLSNYPDHKQFDTNSESDSKEMKCDECGNLCEYNRYRHVLWCNRCRKPKGGLRGGSGRGDNLTDLFKELFGEDSGDEKPKKVSGRMAMRAARARAKKRAQDLRDNETLKKSKARAESQVIGNKKFIGRIVRGDKKRLLRATRARRSGLGVGSFGFENEFGDVVIEEEEIPRGVNIVAWNNGTAPMSKARKRLSKVYPKDKVIEVTLEIARQMEKQKLDVNDKSAEWYIIRNMEQWMNKIDSEEKASAQAEKNKKKRPQKIKIKKSRSFTAAQDIVASRARTTAMGKRARAKADRLQRKIAKESKARADRVRFRQNIPSPPRTPSPTPPPFDAQKRLRLPKGLKIPKREGLSDKFKRDTIIEILEGMRDELDEKAETLEQIREGRDKRRRKRKRRRRRSPPLESDEEAVFSSVEEGVDFEPVSDVVIPKQLTGFEDPFDILEARGSDVDGSSEDEPIFTLQDIEEFEERFPKQFKEARRRVEREEGVDPLGIISDIPGQRFVTKERMEELRDLTIRGTIEEELLRLKARSIQIERRVAAIGIEEFFEEGRSDRMVIIDKAINMTPALDKSVAHPRNPIFRRRAMEEIREFIDLFGPNQSEGAKQRGNTVTEALLALARDELDDGRRNMSTLIQHVASGANGRRVDVTIRFVSRKTGLRGDKVITKTIIVPETIVIDGEERRLSDDDIVRGLAVGYLEEELRNLYPENFAIMGANVFDRDAGLRLGEVALFGLVVRNLYLESLSSIGLRKGFCVYDYICNRLNTGFVYKVQKKRMTPLKLYQKMMNVCVQSGLKIIKFKHRNGDIIVKDSVQLLGSMSPQELKENDWEEMFEHVKVFNVLGYGSMAVSRVIKEMMKDMKAQKGKQGSTIRSILCWAKSEGNVNVIVLEPLGFTTYVKSMCSKKRSVDLLFTLHDTHLYPIDIKDDETKELFRKIKDGDGEKLVNLARPSRMEMSGLFVSSDDEVIISGDFDKPVVYNGTLNAYQIIAAIVNRHHMYVDDIKMGEHGHIEAFKHPVSGLPIVINEDALIVKQVCEEENKNGEILRESFVFKGQSISTMAQGLFQKYVGSIPEIKTNGDNVVEMYNKYTPRAIIQGTGDEGQFTIDATNCYANSLINNTSKIVIPDPGSQFIKMKRGEEMNQNCMYLCEPFSVDGFYFHRMMLTKDNVDKLLNMCDIELTVTHKMVGTRVLEAGFFRAFGRYMEHKYPHHIHKPIMVCLLGLFNSKKSSFTESIVTSSEEFAQGLCNCIHANIATEGDDDIVNHTCTITDMNKMIDSEVDFPLFHIRDTKTTFKKGYRGYVYTHMMGNYVTNMILSIVEVARLDGNWITGVSTDAIYMNSPIEGSVLEELVLPFVMKSEDGSGIKRNCYNFQDKVSVQKWTDMRDLSTVKEGKSVWIGGPGGSGKSSMVLRDLVSRRSKYWGFKGDKRVIFAGPTHQIVNSLREKFDRLNRNDQCRHRVGFRTIASLACSVERGRDIECDIVIIDEVSMMTYSDLMLIKQIDAKFVLLGDFEQVEPIMSKCKDTLEMNLQFMELASFNKIQKRLELGKCRFKDQRTINFMNEFRDTGVFRGDLIRNRVDERLDQNLVYTNECRKRIAKKKGKMNTQIGEGDVVYLRIPRESVQSMKENGVFNGVKYKVEWLNVSGHGGINLKLEGVRMELKRIDLGWVESAVSCTTHKIQGSTVIGRYNIFEVERMNKRLAYTAFSRCTSIDNIHCNFMKVVQMSTDIKPELIVAKADAICIGYKGKYHGLQVLARNGLGCDLVKVYEKFKEGVVCGMDKFAKVLGDIASYKGRVSRHERRMVMKIVKAEFIPEINPGKREYSWVCRQFANTIPVIEADIEKKDFEVGELTETILGDEYDFNRTEFVKRMNYYTSIPYHDIDKIKESECMKLVKVGDVWEYTCPWRFKGMSKKITGKSEEDVKAKVRAYVNGVYFVEDEDSRVRVNFIEFGQTEDYMELQKKQLKNIQIIEKDMGGNVLLIPKLNERCMVEVIDEGVLDGLLKRDLREEGFDHVKERRQREIMEIIKNKVKGGRLKVEYSKSRKCPLGIGRVFPKGGVSLGSMCKELRHSLCKDLYIDVDIDNCHPVLLNQLTNEKYECLDYYVKNREKCLEDLIKALNVSREEAKKAYLVLMYGGELPNKIKRRMSCLPRSFIDFAMGISECMINVVKANVDIKELRDCKSIVGSKVSRIIQEIENRLLYFMVKYVGEMHSGEDKMIVMCFDGMMVRKEVVKVDEEMLSDLEAYLEVATGYKVRLSVKEMNKGLKEPLLGRDEDEEKMEVLDEVVTVDGADPWQDVDVDVELGMEMEIEEEYYMEM